MYDRDTIELALLALEEGMTQVEAAELCGASRGADSTPQTKRPMSAANRITAAEAMAMGTT